MVIGAGQAGLSAAYALQQQGIRPLVLEKNRVAYAWDQQRWDSFCLVTPNWQCRLPDFPYNGDQPDGFMGKSSIVDYLQRFAQHVNADLREGVARLGRLFARVELRPFLSPRRASEREQCVAQSILLDLQRRRRRFEGLL